jgi:hypothetical protein
MKRTVAFVDEVEDDLARLVSEDGQRSFELPSDLLPAGAVEGTWISIEVSPSPPPDDEGTPRRRKLGSDDPGGDLKL